MPPAPSLKWWDSPRALLRAILMLDDTPHSIALGTAIGMLIGLTPTVGMQMILVMVTAGLTSRLFQFNRVAALITVYVSNPITIVPIYYGLYWVGTRFVPGTASREHFAQLLQYDGFAGWWEAVCGLFVDIGAPLILGTVIVAPIGGLLTYPVMLALVRSFRAAPARSPQPGLPDDRAEETTEAERPSEPGH